jgi:ribokinase
MRCPGSRWRRAMRRTSRRRTRRRWSRRGRRACWVVTARRRPALLRSGVRPDVVVGSALDPREACTLEDFPLQQRPAALVLTEGAAGGAVYTERGVQRFPAPVVLAPAVGSYGAGDSFAGALTYFVAAGLPALDACARAARFGAAVLGALDPLEAQAQLD